MQRVSGQGADEGQRTAGAAAGVFDDGLTRRQAPVSLGPSHHRQSHPVLVRTGGIATLDLQPDFAPARAVRKLDQRGVADRIEDAHEGDATLAVRDSKGPGRQSGGDRPANLPDMPIDGDRHRCRLLGTWIVTLLLSPRPTRRYLIGGNAPSESYLRIDLLIEAARQSRADAVHPGLRLSGREPRLRPGRDRRRPDLDRSLPRGDGRHGLEARVEAARRRGRSPDVALGRSDRLEHR